FTVDWADVATAVSPQDGASIVYPNPFLLRWTAVPGAQKYQVSISSDPNLSSLVAGYPTVDEPTTTSATAYSPASRLASGTYYWRVRPYDANNNPGDWSYYTDPQASPADTFAINYDPGPSSISNLSMRDESDAALTWSAGGVSTDEPIVSWDPVPGAASY